METGNNSPREYSLMKNSVYTFLALVGLAGTLAAGEATTSFPKLDVGTLDAGTITADSIVQPYATMTLGAANVTTNAARSFVYRTLTTNGWTYVTNTVAGSVATQANVITSDYILGKVGCYLTGVVGGSPYSVTIAAPGSTVTRSQPTRSVVVSTLTSNGWVTATNTIAGYTNTYPAATIGQKYTIVNGSSAATVTVTSASTILPAAQTITLAPNAMVTLTAVSGGYWQMSDGYVAGAGVGTVYQAYDADLDDLADGSLTASKVASGYDAAGLTGNAPLAVLTNAITGLTGVLITNTTISATGATNTYVFAPIGDKYILKTISTSP